MNLSVGRFHPKDFTIATIFLLPENFFSPGHMSTLPRHPATYYLPCRHHLKIGRQQQRAVAIEKKGGRGHLVD
ncbi:hypothetical protein [Pseudotabrizicola sp. 4114]|uniref:hypothetical protein n=1 Tax=Pseudotabrizicola sp. 4114 TaxID=2817731 RepID=UPI0032B8632C